MKARYMVQGGVVLAASLGLASLGTGMGLTASHSSSSDGSVPSSVPIASASVSTIPTLSSSTLGLGTAGTGASLVSSAIKPDETVGGGGGGDPTVETGGACGVITLSGVDIKPDSTQFMVHVVSVAPITGYEDDVVHYDVGNNEGVSYFEPGGAVYTGYSLPVRTSQSYGDVSADFNGWAYLSGIGWCYFNTPELYYNLG